MPAIRVYSSEVSASAPIGGRQATPSDFGGTGMEQVGAAVQSVGVSAGQAQRILLQNQMRREATQADTATMAANADLTIELQRLAREAKPGDDITETFHGMVRDKFAALENDEQGGSRYETSQGQQYFQNRAAFYSSQFAVESARVQAHLDGVAAVAAHGAMVDTQANMLQNSPTFFESARENVRATINNPNGIYARPGVSAMDRDKLMRQSDEALATAAVSGTILNRPNVALEKLESGWMKEFVPHEKYGAMIQHARTAVQAKDVDADRARRELEWQRIETARSIENSLFSKMAAHDANPSQNPPLTAQDMLNSNLGQFDAAKYGAMIGVLHTRSKEKLEAIQTDPGVMRDLFNRIHLPDSDPRKIVDELPLNQAYGTRGKLSFEDFSRLRKEVADGRTPEGSKLGGEKAAFLKSRMSSITQSNMLLGKLDSDGDTRFGDFGYMVDRKIEQYRKDGKNPHDLFDPEKPDFLGRPERLRPFQKTMTESMKSISEKMQKENSKLPDTLPPEQLRKPGESYGEWKARQK